MTTAGSGQKADGWASSAAKIILVVDGSSVHKAKKVREFVEIQNRRRL